MSKSMDVSVEFARSVAAAIPNGKENAVTRNELCESFRLSDRTIRRGIEKARKEGFLIINDMDGAGYYQVSEEDLERMSRQYWQDTARISAMSKRRQKMRKILKENGWAV